MGTISIESAIVYFGALQGVLLSIFFFTRKVGKPTPQVLAGLIFLFSVNLLLPALVKQFLQVFPHLLGIGDPMLFLFGPLLFFYASFLTGNVTAFSKRDLLHLLPFAACVMLLSPIYLLGGDEKVELYQRYFESGIPYKLYLIWIAASLHNIIYIAAAIKQIQIYRLRIKNTFSNIDRISLRWFKLILSGSLVIWLIDGYMLSSVLLDFDLGFLESLGHLLGYVSTIFIYYIGYRTLKEPETSSQLILAAYSKEENKKYYRSGLSTSKADEYQSALLTFMQEDSPYLNPELTLTDLGQALSAPNNHLSQVLNEKFSQNFFDFINNYRVEEAKQWLSNPAKNQATMLAIAFESGFKSKSTFNAAFKKHTGQTPSEFRKSSQVLRTA
ncbi:MAG: helix-turn-helix domain-containing protein [Cyclobacteriaceae bacterium]